MLLARWLIGRRSSMMLTLSESGPVVVLAPSWRPGTTLPALGEADEEPRGAIDAGRRRTVAARIVSRATAARSTNVAAPPCSTG